MKKRCIFVSKQSEVVMKKLSNISAFIIMLVCFLNLFALEAFSADASEDVFYISAGGKQLTVKMEDSTAARELKAMLADEDLTVSMTGNSFEQYGNLGRNLTANDTYITAQAGDVLLYNSNTICIFYGSNSYQYTRLGKIENMNSTELRELLSGGNLTVTLTNSSFGTVPNTGTANMFIRYEVVIALLGMAAILWIAAARYRSRREESAIEKTGRE